MISLFTFWNYVHEACLTLLSKGRKQKGSFNIQAVSRGSSSSSRCTAGYTYQPFTGTFIRSLGTWRNQRLHIQDDYSHSLPICGRLGVDQQHHRHQQPLKFVLGTTFFHINHTGHRNHVVFHLVSLKQIGTKSSCDGWVAPVHPSQLYCVLTLGCTPTLTKLIKDFLDEPHVQVCLVLREHIVQTVTVVSSSL